MMKIIFRTKRRFTFFLPVPYSLLHLGSRIVTTTFVWNKITQSPNQELDDFKNKKILRDVRKNQLKPIIKELQNQRGKVLVDVEQKDGSRVKIKL